MSSTTLFRLSGIILLLGAAVSVTIFIRFGSRFPDPSSKFVILTDTRGEPDPISAFL